MEPIHAQIADRITGPTIERFYADLGDQGLSATSIHHIHNLLFAAFKWASKPRVGLITRNPFDREEIDRPRRAESNARAFTIEQIEKLLDFLTGTRHENAIAFSLATGCRRGETCGLKWDAVDLRRRVASIRASRFQVAGRQGQKETKARRVREVPLNDMALGALIAQREAQRDWQKAAEGAWIESGHVFSDEFGAPLSPMSLTSAFGRLAKRAGLPTTRMHDLRHTAATIMLSATGNLVAASKILGHADRGTTLRLYAHVIDADVVAAATALDTAFSSRQLSRPRVKTSANDRIRGQNMVALTGVEPVSQP
jgi:integrase